MKHIINKSAHEYEQIIRQQISENRVFFRTGGIVLAVLLLSILFFSPYAKNSISLTSFSAPTPMPQLKLDEVLGNKDQTAVGLVQKLTPAEQRIDVDAGKKMIEDIGETSSVMTNRVTQKPKSYVVQEGDSLASIAEQFYGDSNAWVTVANANNIQSPDEISVGMTLTIP